MAESKKISELGYIADADVSSQDEFVCVSVNSSLVTRKQKREDLLRVAEVLPILSTSGDPAKPAVGASVLWVSDGSGLGNDGDLLIATNIAGTVKYKIIVDFSSASVWA